MCLWYKSRLSGSGGGSLLGSSPAPADLARACADTPDSLAMTGQWSGESRPLILQLFSFPISEFPVRKGSPTSRIWGGADVIIEIKCTINVMFFSHWETIPIPQSMEKLSSTKPIPGAKKTGACCYKGLKDAGVVHGTVSSLTFSVSHRWTEQDLEIASFIFITYHKIRRWYKCTDSVYQLWS